MSLKVVYTGTRAPQAVEGVDVIHVPALETTCLEVDEQRLPSGPVEAIFFSANAVFCMQQSGLLGRLDLRSVVAVGQRTAAAVESCVGVPVSTPTYEYFSGVVSYLEDTPLAYGVTRVAFDLLDGPRDISASVPGVLSVPVYATGAVDVDGFFARVAEVSPSWVIVASPRAADVLVEAFGQAGGFRVAAIGHTTSAHLEALGRPADYVASQPDVGLLLGELKGVS